MIAGVEPELSAVRPLIGIPLSVIFSEFLGEQHRRLLSRCVEEYKRYFFDHCADKSDLFPGVAETLDSLRSRGFSLAVATTKMTFMAERVCNLFGLAPLLNTIQGTDDMPAKPNPAVILRTCEKLRCDPVCALAVGDTPSDIEAGKAAGCRTAAACWGIGDPFVLAEAKPDMMLENIFELIERCG